MTYCFDLDNTLCVTNGNKYDYSVPNFDMIRRVNYLHDEGNQILIFTARGMTSCKGDSDLVYNRYFELTKKQLTDWNVKYDKIILAKPSFDIFIDDKNMLIDDFKKKILPKKGFIAGSFDILHPGYIEMFQFIKTKCDYLTVGLHEDPSIERPSKSKPIISLSERKNALLSLKYVDKVVTYQTEEELIKLLSSDITDIRFLGEDYRNKPFNGDFLPLEVIFIDRSHNWSSTILKNIIYESIKNKTK